MSQLPNTRSRLSGDSDGLDGAATPVVKLILIGIDGLRIDRAFGTGLAPTLNALVETGGFLESQVEVPTISGPGWASILTGSTHAEHGIRDNAMRGNRLAQCPDFLTKAWQRDPRTTTYVAAGWPNIADPAGLGPIIAHRPEQLALGQHHIVSLNGELYGYRVIDPEIAQRARVAIEYGGPDVSFVYFCHTDDAGHYFGVQTREYAEAVELTDARVSLLLNAIDARVAAHNEIWIVAVTTDHGHVDEGGHGGGSDNERQTFLLANVRGGQLPADFPSALEPHQFTEYLLRLREQLAEGGLG
ncbi:alkaline phosphatase family protein [Leucobacter insecticola]|uniref:Alkaline phosphatase family protein n=1 Tax=Leucobacter insecticola TaxID=2714934 RepID=A0A6G8FG12_9MICO|nr:alkaline phosphatase family protein [Leucobacter insecticola]QIM15331.1 alkaline phosphatase family protein [Leucobacter insecticola]